MGCIHPIFCPHKISQGMRVSGVGVLDGHTLGGLHSFDSTALCSFQLSSGFFSSFPIVVASTAVVASWNWTALNLDLKSYLEYHTVSRLCQLILAKAPTKVAPAGVVIWSIMTVCFQVVLGL